MKEKFIDAYMDVAERFAKLSSARRLHVGAIVVKDDRIISIGYNGMPAGWDNNCEDSIQHSDDTVTLKTKPEVLHAETNVFFKVALIMSFIVTLIVAKMEYNSSQNQV
jgi:dCMP deaminase